MKRNPAPGTERFRVEKPRAHLAQLDSVRAFPVVTTSSAARVREPGVTGSRNPPSGARPERLTTGQLQFRGRLPSARREHTGVGTPRSGIAPLLPTDGLGTRRSDTRRSTRTRRAPEHRGRVSRPHRQHHGPRQHRRRVQALPQDHDRPLQLGLRESILDRKHHRFQQLRRGVPGPLFQLHGFHQLRSRSYAAHSNLTGVGNSAIGYRALFSNAQDPRNSPPATRRASTRRPAPTTSTSPMPVGRRERADQDRHGRTTRDHDAGISGATSSSGIARALNASGALAPPHPPSVSSGTCATCRRRATC